MSRRGEPLPINQALNRPRAKLGLDLSAWMAIVFVCVTVFLAGFRLLAMLAFPTLATGAWLIVRKHPKWMAIVFVCVTVFLAGFRLLAMLAFPTLATGAWLIVRKHPKMFQLWGLSLSQKSYYDPRKF